MAKKCELTSTSIGYGNNVSHSNMKTRRVFFPNLQNMSFFSPLLNLYVSFRVSIKGMKSVVKSGSIDDYLIVTKDRFLSKKAIRIKKVLLRKRLAQSAAQPSK